MIEPSSNCNVKCKFCNLSTIDKGNMPWKLFDSINLDNFTTVFLWWRGEPLLNKDIVRMVRKLTDRNIISSITTNALLLTKELADDLVSNGLKRLDISIPGATKEVYESSMVGADFDLFMYNLEYASTLKCEVRLCATATKYNIHQINQFSAIAKKFNIQGQIIASISFDGEQDYLIKNMPKEFSSGRISTEALKVPAIAWNGKRSTLFDKHCTGKIMEPFIVCGKQL